MSDNAGVVIAVQGIAEDGEYTEYAQFAVTTETADGDRVSLDIRKLGQRKDVVWMIDLDDLEAAVKFLKAERRRVGK